MKVIVQGIECLAGGDKLVVSNLDNGSILSIPLPKTGSYMFDDLKRDVGEMEARTARILERMPEIAALIDRHSMIEVVV